MPKTKIVSLAALVFLVFGASAGRALASSGNASFSVADGTYALGSTIAAAVYENSPTDPVNVVQADLTYDPSQLQFIDIDTSQSGFSGSVLGSGGSGSVKTLRYSFTPLTGNVLVATINFKVLSDSGTGQLNFAPSSHIYSNGQDVWDKNTTGATYAFTPPPVAVTPPPVNTNPAPQLSASQPKPQTSESKPADDSVLATTSKLPPKAPVSMTYENNSKNWWAFIGLCLLTVLGLLARLFNLHKRIRAKSPISFLSQALKRAV